MAETTDVSAGAWDLGPAVAARPTTVYRRLAGVVLTATATAVVVLLVIDVVGFGLLGLEGRLAIESATSPRAKLLMAARHRDSRVLYVGESGVLTNFDPGVISRACGCGPGFNAGFGGTDPLLTGVMTRRLLGVLSPEIVVIGVSQWWLSDGADIGVHWAARQVLGPAELVRVAGYPGLGALASSALAVVWRAYRYRDELHASLLTALGRPAIEFRRGFGPRDEIRTPARIEADAAIVRERGFTRFDLRGRRTEAFRRLLDELRDRGIRVFLVVQPLHPASLRRVALQAREASDVIREVAAATGAVVEDLTDPGWLIPSDFADNVHLNPAGAAKLSTYLGARLSATGASR